MSKMTKQDQIDALHSELRIAREKAATLYADNHNLRLAVEHQERRCESKTRDYDVLLLQAEEYKKHWQDADLKQTLAVEAERKRGNDKAFKLRQVAQLATQSLIDHVTRSHNEMLNAAEMG